MKLYSIFHLNLMYSSIEKSSRAEVIRKCYWPLLEMANDKYKIGMEAPALSLEFIYDIDQNFIKILKQKIKSKQIEFLGSGYSQIIAPLVPANVNKWNLEIGQEIYRELLDFCPEIWFVNEQAYSRGILEHYVNIGAKAIIQESNNHSNHFKDISIFQKPQILTSDNFEIPVIWNDSITFQKFQRYAYGEFTDGEFLNYLNHKINDGNYHCIYGGDLEAFNYRPGRFHNEVQINQDEWKRIIDLFTSILKDSNFEFVFPSESLESLSDDSKKIQLESAQSVIPVKKQPKYNITRWALTGRNSVYINSLCYRLYNYVSEQYINPDPSMRKKICYFFSSDFRTHITKTRWEEYLEDLESYLRYYEITLNLNLKTPELKEDMSSFDDMSLICEEVNHRLVKLGNEKLNIVFNKYRGASIESLSFASKNFFGTIPHGYYGEMALSADWYSGNIVFKEAGKAQVTDLNSCTYFQSSYDSQSELIKICSKTLTDLGYVTKFFTLNLKTNQLLIDYLFDWDQLPIGSLRVYLMTFFPDSFDISNLFFATHNGGNALEKFRVASNIENSFPASHFVTAANTYGMTKNDFYFGDNANILKVTLKDSDIRALPMFLHQKTKCGKYFTQLIFSLAEVDESVKESKAFKNIRLSFEISFQKTL